MFNFLRGLWPLFVLSVTGFAFLCFYTGESYTFGIFSLVAFFIALVSGGILPLHNQSFLCLSILFIYVATSLLLLTQDRELTLLSSIPIICLALGILLSDIFLAKNGWTFWVLSIAGVSTLINIVPVIDFFSALEREDGVFLDANLSAFFSLVVVYLFVFLLNNQKHTGYIYLAILLNFLCFAVAFSRFGIVVLLGLSVLSLTVSYVFYKPAVKVYLRVYAIAFFALLVVNVYVIFFNDGSLYGAAESNIANLGKRLPIYLSVLEVLKSNSIFDALFGRGLGMFQALYPQFRSEFTSGGSFVHNDWLQYFLEGGVFGIISLSIFWMLVFYPVLKIIWFVLFKCYKNGANVSLESESFGKLIPLFCITAAIFLNTFVNYSMYSPVLMFILGVVIPCWFVIFSENDILVNDLSWSPNVISKEKVLAYLKFFSSAYVCLLVASMIITLYFVSASKRDNSKIGIANVLNTLSPGLNSPTNYLLEKISSTIDYQTPKHQLESVDYALRLTSDLIESRPHSAYAYYYQAYFMNVSAVLKPEEVFNLDEIFYYLTEAIRIDPSYFSAYSVLFKVGGATEKQFVIEALANRGYCWLKFYKGGQDQDMETIYQLIPQALSYLKSPEERYYLQMLYDARLEDDYHKYTTSLMSFISVNSCSKLSENTLW